MVMGIVKKVFCFFLSRFGSTADFLGLQQHFHVTMCSCTFKICSINLRGHWVKLRDYEGRWVLERFYCRSFGTVTAVITETREIQTAAPPSRNASIEHMVTSDITHSLILRSCGRDEITPYVTLGSRSLTQDSSLTRSLGCFRCNEPTRDYG